MPKTISLPPAAELCRLGWTQKALARDSDGQIVSSTSHHATCWCPIGAILRAYDDAQTIQILIRSLNDWAKKHGYKSIAKWNDAPERTQAEVVELLRNHNT